MKVGPNGERQSIKRKVCELLCPIFRHACETPLDEAGTTLLKRSPVLITIEKPRTKVEYVDVSMEELQTLHDAMKPRLAPLVYLMGMTGLRPEEVYGLQRRNVELKKDLSGGWIHVVNAAKPHPEIDPETGERHRPIKVGKTKTPLSVRDIEIPAPSPRTLPSTWIRLWRIGPTHSCSRAKGTARSSTPRPFATHGTRHACRSHGLRKSRFASTTCVTERQAI